jgi:hypothetical protein
MHSSARTGSDDRVRPHPGGPGPGGEDGPELLHSSSDRVGRRLWVQRQAQARGEVQVAAFVSPVPFSRPGWFGMVDLPQPKNCLCIAAVLHAEVGPGFRRRPSSGSRARESRTDCRLGRVCWRWSPARGRFAPHGSWRWNAPHVNSESRRLRMSGSGGCSDSWHRRP